MASIYFNNEGNNLNLPLTITPIESDRTETSKQPNFHKQPDLTFHCNVCAAFFVNPFELFQHMNTEHPVIDETETDCTAINNSQNNDSVVDHEFDYSCVLEPVCEIVALAEKKKALVVTGIEAAEKRESESDDTDSDDDDDDSSTTSSSSNSSTSSESTNSNNRGLEVLNEQRYAGATYNDSVAHEKNQTKNMNLIISSNPEASDMTGTTITPIKRRRGRRSNAQYMPTLAKEEKCFQCVHCEASFQNAGDLSKHVRSHITNKPFQCSICEKTFTHIGSLNTHLRIHSGDKPYKCEICSKAFTQSSSLMVHLRSHHHSVRKPHQCHLCDKGFVNSSSLVLHLKTHNKMESFVCPECDKVFKQEEQLDEHMRMHTQELVYQCSICRNAFRTSSELVQHMKVHMGEKPFSCSICDARFTQSGSLNIHMRIHTGEKPFHCNICEKSFTQASSLSVHMKIHNPGEKPFPCYICGKSYSQQAYLTKHIQSHTESQTKSDPENLMCIVCGSLHPDVKSLSLHVTQKHFTLLTDWKDACNQAQPHVSNETDMKQLQQLLEKQRASELTSKASFQTKAELNNTSHGIDEEYYTEENVEYDFDYAAEEEVETAD